MTGFIGNFANLGAQPMANFNDPDTVQRHPIGFSIDATDKYWGQGRLVYHQAAEAQLLGSGVIITDAGTATLCPDTANTGFPVLIAISAMAIGEWGWYLSSGRYVLRCGANLTNSTAVGLTGAGTFGANSAGKQLLGARIVRPSATAVVKTCNGVSGGRVLTIQNGDADGWLIGCRITGTGVAASTSVTGIDPSGRFVTIDNALTAQINGGSISMTYTDGTRFFNVVHVNGPFIQGAIT